MLNYFEEQIRRCEEQEQQRITEDRKDEANLQKIRANIFRVFQSVYKRSLKEAQPEVFFEKSWKPFRKTGGRLMKRRVFRKTPSAF